MSVSVWDLAPAIFGVFAGAVGLILVWLAVRQAHRGTGKAERERPGPDAAE